MFRASFATIDVCRKNSQNFSPAGVTSPFVARGDADRHRFRRAGERPIEQAFASHELETCRRQGDAASGFHFSDQRTDAVACHRDARFGGDRGEDPFEDPVILGVILAPETDDGFSSQLFQRDGFQPATRQNTDSVVLVPSALPPGQPP